MNKFFLLLDYNISSVQIAETREVVQLGKWNNKKPEKLYNYESGEGEEVDIIEESSCI